MTHPRSRPVDPASCAARLRGAGRASAVGLVLALAPGATGLGVLVTPAVARAATPAEIERSVKDADALFVAGQYEDALAAYRAAYKLKADPELFIRMGRCFQQMGQSDLAIHALERYLTDAPKGARRADVEQLIATLRAPVVEETLSLDDPEAAPAPPAPAGEPFPEEAPAAAAAPPDEPAPSSSTATAPPPLPPPEAPLAPPAPPASGVDDGPGPVVWVAVGAAALAVVTGGAVAAALALQPSAPAPEGALGTFDLR